MPRLVFIQFHIPILPANGAASSSAASDTTFTDASSSTSNTTNTTPNTPGSASQNISAEEFLRLFSGFIPIHITPLNGSDEIPEQLLRDIAAGVFGAHGPPKPPAMDAKALEELPRFTFNEERTAFMKKHEASEGCTVCLSDFEQGENVTALPCGHFFHTECCSQWLAEHNTCPTCRYEMKVTDQELEKKRVSSMEQRYGKAGFQILEESSQVERLFNIVYDMKLGARAATTQEANNIDLQLEKIIDDLDALENLDENTHAKRREQIVKVQQTQHLLHDVREKCRQEEHLDQILDSTLDKILSQQKEIQLDLKKSSTQNNNTPELEVQAPVRNNRRGTSSSQSQRGAPPQVVTTSEADASFLAKPHQPATPLTPADLSLLFDDDDHNSVDDFDMSDADKKRQSGNDHLEDSAQPRKKRRIEEGSPMQDDEFSTLPDEMMDIDE